MREAKGDKEKGCEPRALYRDRWRAARVSRLAAAMGLLRDGQGSEGGRSDDAAGQHADVDAIVVIWLGCQRCPRREGRPGRRERHHSRHRCGDLAEGVAIGSSRGLISPSTSLSWLATISDRSRNTSAFVLPCTDGCPPLPLFLEAVSVRVAIDGAAVRWTDEERICPRVRARGSPESLPALGQFL